LFEKENLTIEEVLKVTYWWCQDLIQWQIKQQLRFSSHTVLGCVLRYAAKSVRLCSVQGRNRGTWEIGSDVVFYCDSRRPKRFQFINRAMD